MGKIPAPFTLKNIGKRSGCAGGGPQRFPLPVERVGIKAKKMVGIRTFLIAYLSDLISQLRRLAGRFRLPRFNLLDAVATFAAVQFKFHLIANFAVD